MKSEDEICIQQYFAYQPALLDEWLRVLDSETKVPGPLTTACMLGVRSAGRREVSRYRTGDEYEERRW